MIRTAAVVASTVTLRRSSRPGDRPPTRCRPGCHHGHDVRRPHRPAASVGDDLERDVELARSRQLHRQQRGQFAAMTAASGPRSSDPPRTHARDESPGPRRTRRVRAIPKPRAGNSRTRAPGRAGPRSATAGRPSAATPRAVRCGRGSSRVAPTRRPRRRAGPSTGRSRDAPREHQTAAGSPSSITCRSGPVERLVGTAALQGTAVDDALGGVVRARDDAAMIDADHSLAQGGAACLALADHLFGDLIGFESEDPSADESRHPGRAEHFPPRLLRRTREQQPRQPRLQIGPPAPTPARPPTPTR